MHNWKNLVRARLGPLPVDAARAADIMDELAQHVAEHYKDLIGEGVDDAVAVERALAPLAARAAAEIARADRPRSSAPTPPAATAGPLTGLVRDVRYGMRLLLRTPAFTTAAVLTLGLGIGANTAIFSVVNAVLLQPLPYTDPDRLVMIGERGSDGSASNVGYTTFLDWKSRNHTFEDMALLRSFQPTLVVNGEPERVTAMRVSSNFFSLLGVRPALGRDFRADEDTQANWRVLMISDGLWRRRFNADPSVIGRVLNMNDLSFTVIGVMPASFEPLISERYYQRAEMWALVGYNTTLNYACRSCQHLKALGRLTTGVAAETARSDMDAIHAQLRQEFPADYPPATMAVEPLREALTGSVRPALAVLMGAVACVLLIACANVANLLLARMTGRERDLAMRAALGASRARLIRQLLVESALLAAMGGALGILIGATALPLLTALAPDAISRLTGARLDSRVLAFSMLLSLATAFVFGLLPAVRASRTNLQGSLHGDGRKTSRAPTSLARRLLVAADLALAVVLLIGAGLMIKSVGHLLAVNPGFDPDRVLSMQISMIGEAYRKDEAVLAKIEEMIQRLRALPGVESVAMAGQIPLGGNGDRWGFHVQGRVAGPQDPSVERYSVTPDYFSVMRVPLRRGRLFTDADRASTEQVMLVGEQTARTLWPNQDPIGQHVRIGSADRGPWRTIVGIVGDVRHQELAAPPTMQMYTPTAQVTDSFLTVVIRSGGDPTTLAAVARQTIWSIAGDVPVYQVSPLSDLVAKSVAPRRFVMILLEVFGAVALLMTAIGVYGVISFAVAERTREIGIRAALGATSRDIVRLIVGGGLSVVSAGLGVGVLVALAATHYLDASLYNVGARDPLTFVSVTVVLFTVALAAQAIPIARAMRIQPTVALRTE